MNKIILFFGCFFISYFAYADLDSSGLNEPLRDFNFVYICKLAPDADDATRAEYEELTEEYMDVVQNALTKSPAEAYVQILNFLYAVQQLMDDGLKLVSMIGTPEEIAQEFAAQSLQQEDTQYITLQFTIHVDDAAGEQCCQQLQDIIVQSQRCGVTPEIIEDVCEVFLDYADVTAQQNEEDKQPCTV
jgi:hypothetical protein